MCRGVHISVYVIIPHMKKLTFTITMTLILFSGCTQVVTAPISVAGSVAGATIDVAGSAVSAVTPGD